MMQIKKIKTAIKNLFSKKTNEVQKQTQQPHPEKVETQQLVQQPPKPQHHYVINGKKWVYEESIHFKCQGRSDDYLAYGWTLEVRWKDYGWMTYWNKKIYHSEHSAIEAALKIYLVSAEKYEWRVRPLYVMNDTQHMRDFKIDKLLSENPPTSKPKQIRAWKVLQDYEILIPGKNNPIKIRKGTLFIKLESGLIINVRDSTSKTEYSAEWKLNNHLIPNNIVEEVDIVDEKWSHPHLLKELRTKLKI